jgi:hypothetical protein
MNIWKKLLWLAVGAFGAGAVAVLALSRGECAPDNHGQQDGQDKSSLEIHGLSYRNGRQFGSYRIVTKSW